MRYNPNYRGQIFYDSANSIGIDEVLHLLMQEFKTREFKEKMPKTKETKILLFSLLGLSVLCLFVTVLIWIFTRSLAYSIVIMLIGAVYVVGIMCIIATVTLNITRKACSDPVEAVCIGYSLSGGGSSRNYGGRIMRSPVFQYEYQGYKWTAFDGTYDNFSQLPMMGVPTKILVNPSDPEELIWNFRKGRERFLILGAAFAIVLSSAILFVVQNDEKFLNSVIPARAAQVEAGKEAQKTSEMVSVPEGTSEGEFVPKVSDDGRIILDDQYMKNVVWAAYPDSEYILKARKVKELEIADDQSFYVLYFEPDQDFSDSEWFYTQDDVTEEVKNVKPGDEFYYSEVPEKGASWIFSTKEYVLP